MDLIEHSVSVIVANQAATGAIIASPNLDQYRYAWLRDGTFCAHALMIHGRTAAARAFHDWVSSTILRYEPKIAAAIAAVRRGDVPSAAECLHCRFTVDGMEVAGHWGHHQLDGLGSWLWSLAAFAERHPEPVIPAAWMRAADLAAAYLAELWPLPCSDWWEEGEDAVHTSTLAAVAAGLRAHARLAVAPASSAAADDVTAFIRERCVRDGTFVKSSQKPGVDASLISLFVPYKIVGWDDETYQATLARIQAELATSVGIHRYHGDTFYGGGEWLLLTAWLGWACAEAGLRDRARAIVRWMEDQAGPSGDLAEQVPHGLFAPAELEPWTREWGPIATPLLWSHAMYLILVDRIGDETVARPAP